ncbi:restriction endonuclease subunit S [Clostridium perfringens]|uniref:restriction endonuclease subunit S n=1 Tax=Clostridium perfringens TaxID=1502 RepID=UPI002AC6F3A7|nr:restriction endonuclease subunit S [Clostridium perfringens]MDZ5023867.1 hypothetical protein [Clostridium perfringens]MDZ7545546.1 hypothetical protein [Clostridium perfringens]
MKKEVREGYKMTELGEIPSGWKVNKLKNILEVCYGKSQKEVETENGIYKILGTGGVIGYTNEYLWNKPSVLIGRKGTIDKPMYIEEPFWTVDTLFYTKINNENNVKWIYYYLNNIDLKKYNEATGVPSLSVNNLNNIKVITPSLKEQEKIAEILSTVDEQIENTEKLIQKNQELKKGLMQQLLTKGIGHTEFKKTELGYIPKKWEIKKLKEICDVKGGKRLPKGFQLEDEENGLPYIRVADMYMGGVKLNDIKYVPFGASEKMKNYKISKKDLFISVAGTLGIVGEVPNSLDGANLTENADKLCNITINKKFLLKVLQSEFVQNIIESEKTSNAQPKLALTRIKEFLIPVPTIEEQKKISSILVKLDKKIEKYKYKKEKLEELKKGLMQQLLTGKIRVV